MSLHHPPRCCDNATSAGPIKNVDRCSPPPVPPPFAIYSFSCRLSFGEFGLRSVGANDTLCDCSVPTKLSSGPFFIDDRSSFLSTFGHFSFTSQRWWSTTTADNLHRQFGGIFPPSDVWQKYLIEIRSGVQYIIMYKLSCDVCTPNSYRLLYW